MLSREGVPCHSLCSLSAASDLPTSLWTCLHGGAGRGQVLECAPWPGHGRCGAVHFNCPRACICRDLACTRGTGPEAPRRGPCSLRRARAPEPLSLRGSLALEVVCRPQPPVLHALNSLHNHTARLVVEACAPCCRRRRRRGGVPAPARRRERRRVEAAKLLQEHASHLPRLILQLAPRLACVGLVRGSAAAARPGALRLLLLQGLGGAELREAGGRELSSANVYLSKSKQGESACPL
jgi:hypothetical protein